MTNHLIQLEQQALKLKNNGDFKSAVELYKIILAENPNYEFGICFYDIADCWEKLGDLKKAKENYQKAIEYDNDDDMRLGGYASFLYLHGNLTEAFEAYLKLMTLEKKRNLDISDTLIALNFLGQQIGLSEEDVINKINQA